MRQNQVYHHWRRLLASRPAQVLLIIVLILMGESVVRFYQRERLIAVDEQSLERELSVLKMRRDELLTDVVRLGTDRGVEGEIREHFGVVKEGEKVINLVGEVTTTTPTTTAPSLWQKITDWLR